MLIMCAIMAVLLRGGAWSVPPSNAAASVGFPSVGTPAYLEARTYALAKGEPLTLTWKTGEGALAWPEGLLRHVLVRTLGEQTNADSIPASDGVMADVPSESTGVVMAGVMLAPATVRPDGNDLARLEAASAPVRAGTNVTLVRCAKVLARLDDEQTRGRRSPIATSKTGQPAEIRPLMDPTVAAVGSDVPLRVYAGLSARGGAALRARLVKGAGEDAAAGDSDQTLVADGSGIAIFHVTRPGVWVIEYETVMEVQPVVHEPGEAGVMTWYQVTLSFEVPTP